MLSSEEATALLKDMDVSTVVDLRDRALIGVMTYPLPASVLSSRSMSRITIRRKNAGGSGCARKTARSMKCPAITSSKPISMPTSKRGALLMIARGRYSAPRSEGPKHSAITRCRALMSVTWRRGAVDADIETAIACHTFRATGITDYLTNGGKLEIAQRMAGHSNAKTTGLYDRRNGDISVSEVERVGI